MNHAILAPSSASAWVNCSASPTAALTYPQPDTDESRLGTAAHWVAEETLRQWRDADAPATVCSQYIGQAAPNGVIIDAETAECAQQFVDDVLAVCQEHGALRNLLIEHRVNMPQIHAENWGTLDAAIILPGLIYIWDYKHGFGEVSADENWQLIDYLAGLVGEMDGHEQQHTRFVARVVQPRCYSRGGAVSEWTGMISDLRGYWNKLAAAAAEATCEPTMTTGVHCRHCPGRLHCTASCRATGYLVDLASAPMEFDTMPGDALAAQRQILIDGLSVAKRRLEAIEDELIEQVKRGKSDSGLTLEARPGSPKWNCPPEQAAALAAQFGADINKPGVLTPTQAAKVITADMRGYFKQAIEGLTARSTTTVLINAADSVATRAFKRK